MKTEEITIPEPTIGDFHVYQITGFISTCRQLLPSIHQGWREQAYEGRLPFNITEYLATQLRMTASEVNTCWKALKGEITRKEAHPLESQMPSLPTSRANVEHLNKLDLRKHSQHPNRAGESDIFAQRQLHLQSRPTCAQKRDATAC